MLTNKFMSYLLILICFIGLAGCQESQKKSATPITDLQTLENSNNQYVKDIQQNASQIKTDSQTIQSIITNSKIDNNSISIKIADSMTIRDKARNIEEHIDQVLLTSKFIEDNSKQFSVIQKTFNTQLNDSNKEIAKIQNQYNKLKDENEQKKRFIYSILTMIAGIGIAAGIALFFFGQAKVGIPITFASVTLLAVTIFLQRFELYIAIAAGILLIFLIGYVIYNAWNNKKTSLTNKKALEEVVKMVDERIKPSLSQDVIDKLFGQKKPPAPTEPLANKIQSKETQKIIADIRGKTLKN